MRILLRAACYLVATLLLLYIADSLWLRLRLHRRVECTRTLKVRLLLAVPQKNGRVEFLPGGDHPQSCSLTVFPQLGLPPCWYLERHTRRQVNY
jgi:hypothetical protein